MRQQYNIGLKNKVVLLVSVAMTIGL